MEKLNKFYLFIILRTFSTNQNAEMMLISVFARLVDFSTTSNIQMMFTDTNYSSSLVTIGTIVVD